MSNKEFLEVIKRRRTVRQFKKDTPPEEDIMAILEAACYAPYGGHGEPWKFVFVRNKAKIVAMGKAIREYLQRSEHEGFTEERIFFGTYFENAPVVIAAAWKPASVIEDFETKMASDAFVSKHATTIGIMSLAHSIENLLLAATAFRLGAGYIGPFHGSVDLESILSVEKPYLVSTIIPIGYPADERGSSPKDTSGLIELV